ncbi:MAG: hypothetical protein IID49_04790 [Proteobacteria bacterium]|nr:hypothetical protein [Pseudomonadota bacterium]
MRAARVDPAGRPLENRRRQGAQAIGIVAGWVVVMMAIFWATGGSGRDGAAVPWLLAVGVFSWAFAEIIAGRRGLVWPGSALGIVGPLSVGLGLSVATPEMRAAAPEEQMAVLAGTSALLMCLFLFRFRLPGLVSPVVTFTIVALFLGLYGADPDRLREVEGFSPRGILAAMMRSPVWVAGFGLLSAAAVATARRLDLKGDDFGLASARPLHVIGAGVLALVVGRWLALLPQPLDLILLTGEAAVVVLWALRINRIGVMFTAHLAMARPLVLAITGPLGLTLERTDWAWILIGICIAGFVAWPTLHEQSLRHNWTLGPGGRIPQPRANWWWRYWPYA